MLLLNFASVSPSVYLCVCLYVCVLACLCHPLHGSIYGILCLQFMDVSLSGLPDPVHPLPVVGRAGGLIDECATTPHHFSEGMHAMGKEKEIPAVIPVHVSRTLLLQYSYYFVHRSYHCFEVCRVVHDNEFAPVLSINFFCL